MGRLVYSATTARVDVRAVLKEGQGDIEVCYVDTHGVAVRTTYDYGIGATSGIQSGTGTGTSIQYSCNTATLLNGPGADVHGTRAEAPVRVGDSMRCALVLALVLGGAGPAFAEDAVVAVGLLQPVKEQCSKRVRAGEWVKLPDGGPAAPARPGPMSASFDGRRFRRREPAEDSRPRSVR